MTDTPSFVTLAALAQELGLNRSNLRKYVLKHGFAPLTVRTPESRAQLTLALSPDDAEAIRALRQSQGFDKPAVTENGNQGYCYVIRLVPDLAPNRIKLGFATNAVARLSSHRTSAPTAELLRVWPCRRAWEPCAITSLTRIGCSALTNEVYECEDVPALIERGDAFFALMPTP